MTNDKSRSARSVGVAASGCTRRTSEQRSELVGRQSRFLSRLIDECGVLQYELAEAIGRPPQVVQRILDPAAPETLSIVDVRSLCESDEDRMRDLGVRIARWMLDPCGRIELAGQEHDSVDDDLSHLADMQTEYAELSAHMLRAVSNGHLSKSECTQALREIDDVLDGLHALRTRVRAAAELSGERVRRRGERRP